MGSELLKNINIWKRGHTSLSLAHELNPGPSHDSSFFFQNEHPEKKLTCPITKLYVFEAYPTKNARQSWNLAVVARVELSAEPDW